MLNQNEITSVRSFNRNYTKLLGLLNKKVLDTPLSWTEGRVILEIYFNKDKSPIEVATNLDLDKSYTSRILKRFEKNELIYKSPSSTDLRSKKIHLTTQGTKLAQELDKRSDQQIKDLLIDLTPDQQEEFFNAVETLDKLLFTRK